ncbi:MAG TPA: hypothetical protein VKD72_17800 [Gemmataceae bacterium]|nr:hypothetical protein [Gemmataceae bacterium]
MSEGRRRRRFRPHAGTARVALAWGLGLFACLQLILGVSLEWWTPGVRELQHGIKHDLLRQRLRETPGRPLVLFMGTSRTLNGLDPAKLSSLPADGAPAPLAFNFAHAGAGPLRQLLLLRRLLDEGIHPTHIFLEVLPALLSVENEAEGLLDEKLVGWRDWPAMARYWPEARSRAEWCRANLVPCAAQRYQLLGRLLPHLLSWQWQPDWPTWSVVNGWGFLRDRRESVDEAQYRKGLESARHRYAGTLRDFHISTSADRALREFLDLCRARGIGVTLYLMPEARPFRDWYTAATEKKLRDYLDRLRKEHHLAVIDARRWAPDAGFLDGHHLLPAAAADFSCRFGREVYQPFLAQQRCSRNSVARRGT